MGLFDIFSMPRVSELRHRARRLGLEGVDATNKYSINGLKQIYNGIGADTWPDWLSDAASFIHKGSLPAVLLHDVHFHELRGNKKKFDEANAMFARNLGTLAADDYRDNSWKRQFFTDLGTVMGGACQRFGGAAWHNDCQCKYCRAMREAEVKVRKVEASAKVLGAGARKGS